MSRSPPELSFVVRVPTSTGTAWRSGEEFVQPVRKAAIQAWVWAALCSPWRRRWASAPACSSWGLPTGPTGGPPPEPAGSTLPLLRSHRGPSPPDPADGVDAEHGIGEVEDA